MHNILAVELSGGKDCYVSVELPLTAYEMLDALDKLRITPQEEPDWEILALIDYPELRDWIGSGSVYELNALTMRLSELNDQERVAFDGLLEMEKEKGQKIIPMHRLLDLAYSTDQCHLLGDIQTAEQLGRFAAENGFVPQVDLMSDELFEMLDFRIIGERFMRSEGGVIVKGGYVAQDGDLEQDVWQKLDLPIHRPDYTVLLELSRADSNQRTTLALPASPSEMDASLDRIGAAGWDDVSYVCIDCRVPALCELITDADNAAHANRTAEYLDRLQDSELPKYKALLGALDIAELHEALDLTQRLDEYQLSPEQVSFEGVGHSNLMNSVDEQAIETLLPHVNLYLYGHALQTEGKVALTSYGSVERTDGQPLMAAGAEEKLGMEMMPT